MVVYNNDNCYICIFKGVTLSTGGFYLPFYGFSPGISISPQSAREFFDKCLEVVFQLFNSTFDFKISLRQKDRMLKP